MPSFYEIIKLGIASRLFIQLETKTFKTKVQLVWLVVKIVIWYVSISLMPLFGETNKNYEQIGNWK